MNRGEIRSRIFDALNDPTPIFWTTAEMDEVIGEALEIIAEESASVKRTAFVPFRDGTTYYSLRGIASDVMSIYRVWDETNSQRLTPVTERDLDTHNERWVDVTGNPENWFAVSWDLFGIYPRPAAGGGIMRVDYVAWPRTLLDDSDEPELFLGDHESLVEYGIYDGLLKRWDFRRAMEAVSPFAQKVFGARARAGANRVESRLFARSGDVADDLDGT